MKKFLLTTLFLCASISLFSGAASGQKRAESVNASNGDGNPVLIIVGTAAKMTFETAKFTAKHVIKPTAKIVLKPLVMKLLPKATVFVLKLTGTAAKRTLPAVGKLGLKYLKSRLPI